MEKMEFLAMKKNIKKERGGVMICWKVVQYFNTEYIEKFYMIYH